MASRHEVSYAWRAAVPSFNPAKNLCALACCASVAACSNAVDLAARDAGAADASTAITFDASVDVGGPDATLLEAGPAFAVLDVVPSHGPFIGGSHVEVRGRGWSSSAQVSFGGTVVPSTATVVPDPSHIQVSTPPGAPGSADVVVHDPTLGQSALLPAGFEYDDFYADPSTGATSGGTIVAIVGSGTKWATGTKVTIDGNACTTLVVVDATHMTCTAPPGTPGVKSIGVTTPDGVVETVLDAYTYSDSPDGYRGGLAGDALPGELDVIAASNDTGDLLEGATVVVRGSDGSVQTMLTSVDGVASFPAPPPSPLTVTITEKCFQPTTFDGVKVKSVTAYLDDVLSIECIPPSGFPPVTGGAGSTAPIVQGQLVFPGAIELARAPWNGVPNVKLPTDRRAAYLFVAQTDNLARFYLPDPSTATTDTSPGDVGYSFSLTAQAGNLTIYAIAGIEHQPEAGQRTFDPYVLGVVQGVAVPPLTTVTNVLIPMTIGFTQELDVAVSDPPIGLPGPDRLDTNVVIDLGPDEIVLPNGAREDLLPTSSTLAFLGVPGLEGALASASYDVAVLDVTGSSGGLPTTGILRRTTRSTGAPLAIGSFVPIPSLTSPTPTASWSDATIVIDLPPSTADLINVKIATADGVTGWNVIAPGDSRTIVLPDFSATPELGLRKGPFTLQVDAARLPAGFDYQTVRYSSLYRSSWTAYATNVFYAQY